MKRIPIEKKLEKIIANAINDADAGVDLLDVLDISVYKIKKLIYNNYRRRDKKKEVRCTFYSDHLKYDPKTGRLYENF